MDTAQDTHFMQLALEQAAKALALNEVPVGAVLVANGVTIATGYNRVITDHDPSAHAEIMALRAAGRAMANYRLPETTLYVTLEPCPMCLAALFHARVARVVFGASDAKTGACGGNVDLSNLAINHHTAIEGGVMALECAAPLQAFFKARREAAKQAKVAKLQP
jgi:tRNA(adenine34) deaminase